jgi:ABC-type uncharacterized transport system substrate-binding protein
MIERRAFISGIALALFVAPLAAVAQQAPKVYRIGLLWAGSFDSVSMFWKDFQNTLSERGWIEGRNIVLDRRAADGQLDRLPPLAAELLAANPHVILVSQVPALQAVRKLTSVVPIVMVGIGDPLRYGIVTSLAKPDGNVTGAAFMINELGLKLLGLLKEALPGLMRVAVVVNPANAGAAPFLEDIRAAAPGLGVTILAVEVTNRPELDRALDGLPQQRPDALLVGAEAFLISNLRRIVDFAASHRWPVVGPSSTFPNAGALLSYSLDSHALFQLAATYVDRLLRGAKPGDLPIEQPTKFELVINLKTAKALGLTIPQSLLQRADEVIE